MKVLELLAGSLLYDYQYNEEIRQKLNIENIKITDIIELIWTRYKN